MSKDQPQEYPVQHRIPKPIKVNYKVNKDLVLLKALQGHSNTDIATQFEVTPSAISQMLKPYKQVINGFLVFKEDKATALEMKQFLLVNNLNDATIKKMSGRDTAVSIGILHDKIRLERDQSTANVASLVRLQLDSDDADKGSKGKEQEKVGEITPDE